MPSHTGAIVIGLMSGTSLDGVDAVALEIDPNESGSFALPRQVLGNHSVALPAALKTSLSQLCTPLPAAHSTDIDLIERLGDARRDLTDLYAAAVAGLPTAISSRAVAIGAHGQTIRHRPERSFSLQIIDGARLAESSQLPVVTDFRAADIAAGGQGAPLAPVFHQAMLSAHPQWRAVLNLGGIANVTVLSEDGHRIEAGFDTGPANRLMDEWCRIHTGHDFDAEGQWATSGQVNHELLNLFLAHDFFARPAPKSTGREEFSMAWINEVITRLRPRNQDLAPADVQASLLELTAQSVARALAPYKLQGLLVCGGGAANTALMNRLRVVCGTNCISTDAIGINPQQVEGAAFAWLAWHHVSRRAVNPGSGAAGARVAGALYPSTVGP